MSANLIRAEDDRYYDVAGRPASPYSTVTSFLASPLFVENTKLYAGRHYFYVDSRFILSNTGLGVNSIQSVSINYNGTVTTQPPGTPLQVDFQTSTQEQTITLTVTLTNGVSYVQPVTIPELPYTTTQPLSCDGGTQITVKGAWFDGGYGTGGYEAEGTAYIYFADQNCQTRTLRKPIVFLDGFDPDNSRDHNEIYQKNINRLFQESGASTRLGNELRSNGYDIVIFDYNKQGKKYDRGGAGLVENNGLAVAKLLTTLHDTYSSSIEQDFVVIGPSMGALVGQYALAFMEKNNIPHHTRLFVSFDGPHQGANLSIGLQSFIDIFLRYGNLSVFKSLSHGLHQSASAKQMLVDHSSVLSEAPEPHPYRSIFLRNLAAAGNYPTQCRTIAITSGSGNGTLNQNFNPCDKLVQMAVKKRLLPNCTNNYCYKMKADIFASAESNSCLAVNFSLMELCTITVV